MAGTKINTKSKGKDDKGKSNKNLSSTNEEGEDHDFSLLRKPILTSITGFAQARKIFDFATEELKSLLANECDLLYECKVCRNIFRSLANLISHKRVYCKEKFSSSVHSHFIQNTSAASEMLKIKRLEEAYQESLKVTEDIPNENDDRIALTKDLTGIVEKLSKIRGRYNFDEQQVTLQKIPNNSVAVFQSHSDENKMDNMQAQVQELNSILSRDQAVLQKDGSFNVQTSLNADKKDDSDNVIQISDDEDSDETLIPKCKICDMQFSTQKTLKFHMKYKHLESRLVYPCPDCFEIFSTSWSVYRHLFKVHRKSAAQIRRLRESIQAKAFKMNNPPASYEKRKNMKQIAPQKISEEERLEQENQAWMDNMEGDGELPRCGGCGRTFERRAALAAHTHTCQPRSRALARRPPENKKIEIQIRKDYNKGPPSLNLMPKTDSNDNKPTSEDTQTVIKERPEKQPEPMEKTSEPVEKPATLEKKNEKDSRKFEKDSRPIEKKSDPAKHKLVEATMDIIDDKSSDSIESPEKAVPVKQQPDRRSKMRLPFAHQVEKSNLAAFKQRMLPDIDLDKLACKKCDIKLSRVQDLLEHMAGHYKWMRYACKLCNFKNYDFEKLPEHVKVVHKLKGDSDFYFSTVKAIDGTEALELAEPVEESDVNEESSESRRPSRCSSDSSRLSDDSSSSSTRMESGARKRKMYHNRSGSKRKKDPLAIDETDDIKESDVSMERTITNVEDSESLSNIKTFEENSSDIEDVEDKLAKRHIIEVSSSVASRRPVRKKTKPKNADFEYDLSNLLKMEAQGYRDSMTVTTTKPAQNKKKIQEIQSNYDNINKDHIGALALLSKKAVDKAAAELKTSNFSPPIFNIQKEQRTQNIFARPMLPKLPRWDKMSPKKDNTEEAKDIPSKVSKIKCVSPNKNMDSEKLPLEDSTGVTDDVIPKNTEADDKTTEQREAVKQKLNIPAVVPIKFRRQSLELMKNPIINKNITEFSKAGMKTKILLIKPINRNKDGVSVNTPLKFQTIKLKEPKTSQEDKDQIVVVKVPKVERTAQRSVSHNNINKRLLSTPRTDAILDDTIPNARISDTEKLGVNSKSKKPKRCNSAENVNDNCSSLDNSEIEESFTDNVDKTNCNNEPSSNDTETNTSPVPMEIEEMNTNTVETGNVINVTSNCDKIILSNEESSDTKIAADILGPSMVQSSVQESDQKVETVSNKNQESRQKVETVNKKDEPVDSKEFSTPKNAITLQESVDSQDSETNLFSNGDITPL